MQNATSLNLSSIIEHHARLTPKKEAVVWDEIRITYGQLNIYANKIANALVEMGIGYGDKVALSCPNLPYFPMVYYGIIKTGAIVVPLNVLFQPREIAYHLQDSDSKAVFVFEGTTDFPLAKTVKAGFDEVGNCKDLVVLTANPASQSPLEGHQTLGQIMFAQADEFESFPTKPDDTCAILYTSGTTGQPKGAELTHSNIYLNALVAYNLHVPGLNYTDGIQKVCLITLPLFHTTGQTAQMNAQLLGGHRIVLQPRFEAKSALEVIKKEEINFWTGVPTMYWAILRYIEENNIDPEPFAKTMSIFSSGGAPMPLEIMRKFEEMFCVRILEGYGLSETSPIANFNHPNVPSKPGTVGQPVFGVDVKCFDDQDQEVPNGERGEIVIRGHNVMKGYYKRPEATAEALRNGWFHTGDIGIIDDEGYLQIVDRKKDMILRGGYNVYPRELEEVFMTHPAVSLVAVLGVPDAKMGEEIKAYIVKKQGFEELAELEMLEWGKKQFAAYKYPRFIEFRTELPISGTGKILKRTLREELDAK